MNRISKRYAAGLYEAAEELRCTDAVADELLDMASLVELTGESLSGPAISDAEKAALLRELLAGQVSPLTLEFVLLMVSRHVIGKLPEAAEEFERLSGKAKVVIHLRAPYPLPGEVLAGMIDRLVAEGLVPAGVADRAEFEATVDKSLLGGFIAEYGGRQLDMSFKTVLEKAK